MLDTNALLLASEPQLFDEDALKRLLLHAKQNKASDVYLKGNARVRARIDGELHCLTRRTLYINEVNSLAGYLYGGPNAEVELKRGRDLDGAYTFRLNRRESLRFRWNATGAEIDGGFGTSIILRELPEIPPLLERASLGEALYGALYPHDGIVLVCGPTGSGKSTFLAGMIRDIAENPASHSHILTYESPVEFVYDKIDKPTTEIESTSIPDHLPNFAAAIRNSLRRDPDIIVVGEMRDAETIGAAILAAQTGHAVYGTIHSTTVGATFTRILQGVPKDEQQGILAGLIDSLRLVVCQELVPAVGGGRTALREYLVFDAAVRQQLLQAAVRDITLVPDVAQRMTRERGQTKVMHARTLHAAGRIGDDVVLRLEAAEGAVDDAAQEVQ